MYLIDSDVLITAKNSYYAFDLCPGFWNSLLDKHQNGQVHSLDRNRMELQQGRDDDDLVRWVQDTVPTDFFLSTHQADVVAAYTEVMLWAQRNPQYFDNAKAKFATGADGWLVAYARIHDCVVVTAWRWVARWGRIVSGPSGAMDGGRRAPMDGSSASRTSLPHAGLPERRWAVNESPPIKLPDVCIQFGVRYENVFTMLRALQVQYN